MSRNARSEGLSRRHRFAERGSFGPVLRGSRKVRGDLAVVHAAPATGGAARLGIALTRRLVPSALERNRVKRIVRETFRRHAVKRGGLDCVVSLREKFDASRAAQLRDEVRMLFDRLGREPAR